MKFLYRPFGLAASVLGGLLAGYLFKQLWKIAGGKDDAPKARDKDSGWPEVITAAAIEGALFGAVKAAIDRAGATGFAKITGAWPN